MNKKFVLTAVLMFVFSVTLGAQFTTPVRAEENTLYISSDYTFTEDIYETIFPIADDIVIDGNGYTLQGPGFGFGFHMNSRNNVTLKNVTIKGWGSGVYLYCSLNNTVSGNNITANNRAGIWLHDSSNNTISGNTVTNNDFSGIELWYSSNYNSVSGNNLTANDDYGIYIWDSSNYNSIFRNNIVADVGYGIFLRESSNNVIYHNNFIDNGYQAYDDNPANNNWHHHDLLEGNYWSDYPGVDDGSGTGKHAFAGDGIGDTDIPWPGADYDYYLFTEESGWKLLSGIDTPTGAAVEVVDPVTEVIVAFEEVISEGKTKVAASEKGPAPPADQVAIKPYYHIKTTAKNRQEPETLIKIALPYDAEKVTNPKKLKVMEYKAKEEEWADVTKGIAPEEEIAYAEVKELKSIFAIMEPLDVIPPTTELTISPHYIDGAGNVYVTSATEFTLTANDAVSGVAHTYYCVNCGDWIEYVDAFKLAGPDGTYTIEYYSVDVAGNEETPKSGPVTLVNLKVNSYLTDSDFNPITYFDLVFVKDKAGGYRLVATNPGQFYYNIEVMNDWPVAVDTLAIDVSIPQDFVLKGAVPIHIYLDGIDITDLCTIEGNTITVTNVPTGSKVYVTIHLDYALKYQYSGMIYASLEEFGLKGYTFTVIVSGSRGLPSVPGEGLTGTYSSSATLSAHQKKTTAIAGFVTDADGNPIVGATVELFDSEGILAGTMSTDENGFFYFIDIPAGEYTIKVTSNSQVYIQTATAVSKELTQVDFKIE